MRKLSKNLAMYICMFVVVFCAMALRAEAANVTSGTLGDNGGFTWTYDADTRTLTITGEDSGLQGRYDYSIYNYKSPFESICSDVEHIVVQDCTLKGSVAYMFARLDSLQRVDFYNVNTTNVTNMQSMFWECKKLSSIDLSSFDTSNVTNMREMFSYCESLESLDVSGFDTSNVTDMSSMFFKCYELSSLDVSNFNTPKVTNMVYMFYECKKLSSLDVSNFNTSKVTNMRYMFSNCESLESLDVSSFDTTNVTEMEGMFYSCKNLSSLDVSNFNTTNLEYMGHMFENCKNLNGLDLSGLDLSNVVDASDVFLACDSLTVIHTPKRMPETLSIKLWRTYADLENNRTTNLTKDFCNTTLINVEYLVSEIKLNAWSLALDEGKTGQLSATVLPENAIFKTVTWESSNTAVATVDATGKVTAVGEGSATITATAKDGTGKKATCEVTVVNPVKAFVERMYTVALGRAAEAEGLNFYVQRLFAGDSNGACLAESFLCSPEFLNKGHSDAEYVKVLYRTFFDREPAAEEVNYWVDKLSNGQTKAFVLSGFVNSYEFDNLCAQYGISRGFMREDGKPLNPGIGRFAERMYTVVLERAGEKEGIEYWSLSIANGVCTPKDAAKNFFLSPEYVNKNTSDAQYITTLYKAFMDREPEAGGVEYWQNVLKNGATREQILEGFADSVEFKGIMASFGL